MAYNRSMPELSRFYGIIIRMYMEAGIQHNLPHFHSYYQNETAVFGIKPIALIAGYVPLKQQRLIEAWVELHQEELENAWELLQLGKLPGNIKPLH